MIYYILINHQWDKAMDFFQWYTGELIADIMDDRGVDITAGPQFGTILWPDRQWKSGIIMGLTMVDLEGVSHFLTYLFW
jgi:hypothetical protein